jgi:hypothetical protein
MKWRRLLLWVVAAAVIGGIWNYFHPSPERQIINELHAVARAATFAPGEGAFSKLNQASRLADYFSTNVEVNVNLPDHQEQRLVGRDEIQQATLALLASGNSLNVTFPDMTFTITSGSPTVVVDLTLLARITGHGNTDQIAQEMKFTLRKIEGHWLIIKVETIRTLK